MIVGMTETTEIQLRVRLPLLWLALLAVAAIALPDRVWNTLLIGFGGMFGAGYLWVWFLAQGLHAKRHLHFGWVAVGDRLEETLEIRNDSGLPALWVEVVDSSNVPGYRAAVVRSVGAGQVDRWRETAVCRQRGSFHLGPWFIRSSDPFGIFQLVRHYPQTTDIIIHPPVHGNLPVSLPVGRTSGHARRQERNWQATINTASVREYQRQDPLNWIHWRTTARKGALFVKQFDQDSAGDVWLVLDLQTAVQLGSGLQGTEEQAVLLAASLSAQAIGQNRAVGVAGYGRSPQIVPPGRGQGQAWKNLRALALVQADGEADFSAALADLRHIAQRGSTAVLITASHNPAWLPALLPLAHSGVQSTVLLLDRATFGGEAGSEGLREAIRQLGFPCQLIRRGELGQPLSEESHHGYWQFKVSPLGKVITIQDPTKHP